MLFKYQGPILDRVIYKKIIPRQHPYMYPQDPESIYKVEKADTYTVDLSGINYLELFIWGGILFAMIALPFLPNFDQDPNDIISYIFYSLFLVFFSYMSLNCLLECKQVFVFNRKQGTVTYPRFWFFTETVPFSQSLAIMGKQGPRSAVPVGLAFLSKNKKNRSFVDFIYPYSAYSFYVWYMDKNRPLPPGTAFDPYREEDYLRRRAEGFLAPLYPSAIETPEWEGAVSKYGDKGAKERGFARYEPRWASVALVVEEELPDRLLNDEQEPIETHP